MFWMGFAAGFITCVALLAVAVYWINQGPNIFG